ncbi:LysR family transcriptional regulator [Lactobacillus sp. ESL0684]|uniref:LysR family transcriptional regulator n=1 Tax=Lactobacillus sp. ESL0684 TaxID=2983213 RepID=UPI0023F846F7|nr:LysR family transcriptional regulator [Lactobacillus sp. ESL0684]WEV44096.1 LysR family transcriptional regulator [Lactobacillus sp. ESL0684]
MELRVLKYFLAIIQEHNISNAAKKLHLSQPAISRQIADLEKELGTTLFKRGTKVIELTPDGEYLANQATQILTLTSKTVANLGNNREIKGSIMIGCSEAPMITIIADTINKIKKIAPNITINLHSCDANEVQTKIQNGLFDFGFVLEPFNKINYNFLNLPGTTRWGILTRKDSALAQKSQIIVADLDLQPLIMPQRPDSRSLLNNWLGESEHNFQVIGNYNLLNNAAILAESGVGHVLCLDGIINTAQSNLVFIPLAPKILIHSILIWPKTASLSPAAELFLSQLKQILT